MTSPQIGALFLIIVGVLFWRVRSLQALLHKRKNDESAPLGDGMRSPEPAPAYHDVAYYGPAEKTTAATQIEPVEAADTGRQFHELAERQRDPHELP